MVKLSAKVTGVTVANGRQHVLRLFPEHRLGLEDSSRWIPGSTCDTLIFAVKAKILNRKQERIFMPKRTFQPNRRHRVKTHGFRARMKTKAGAAVLSRRRAIGRRRVSVSAGFRD